MAERCQLSLPLVRVWDTHFRYLVDSMIEKYSQLLSGFFMQDFSACVMEEESSEEGSGYERAFCETLLL